MKNHVSLKHICKICVVYVTLATINKNSFKPKHLTKTYSTFLLSFFFYTFSHFHNRYTAIDVYWFAPLEPLKTTRGSFCLLQKHILL